MINYCTLKALKGLLQSEQLSRKLIISVRACTSVTAAKLSLREKYELPIPKTDQKTGTKLLKIAIIGTPNAGKSTLINRIVERRIFAMSKKVHTTRSRAKAVHVEGNTQLVFLDTPGLVSATEIQKYKLGKQFMCDGEDAIDEANVIGVVHDVSNHYTRHKLDPKVLRLLYLYEEKESFLILNKIDTMKSKRTLLDLSKILTGDKLRDYREPLIPNPISEITLFEIIKRKKCWEKFSDVFMVSALLGKGTSDIKTYLLNAAQPGEWIFEPDEFTDQEPVQVIQEAVKSKLLDHLPQEIPYCVDIELEYLDINNESITAVVLIGCKTPHIEKLVLGNNGKRIGIIAREAEQALIETYMTNVHLKLVVTPKQPKMQDHLIV